MSKDYKSYSANKKKKSKKKKSSGKKPIVMWLVVVLLIVVFVSGLYWLSQLSSKKQSMKVVSVKVEKKKNPVKKKPIIPKIKFEFYNLLPKENDNLPTVNTGTVQQPQEQIRYILQVASLKNFSDADTMKAKLILNGYNVQVKKITSTGTVWYRVQVGPFGSINAATNAQVTLRKEKFDSIIRKVS
jgi:cell division protein FtsN